MEAKIIQLAGRKRRSPMPLLAVSNKPRYLCMNCDGETFTLMQNGDVECTRCRHLMANLIARYVGDAS